MDLERTREHRFFFFSYEGFERCINSTPHITTGLSSLVLDRIFSETVFLQPAKDNRMSYWDFVYFILSEEARYSCHDFTSAAGAFRSMRRRPMLLTCVHQYAGQNDAYCD